MRVQISSDAYWIFPDHRSKSFCTILFFISWVVKHLDKAKVQKASGYPEVITRLPEAEIPFEGAIAWILQAERSQIVFFQFEPDMELPAHSHSYAQWGIVIEGEMELNVDGKPRICRKGDEYLIPAGAVHSAKFSLRTRVMDLFLEKNRYKPKQIK
jgi:quercetin dioxygenase-like cupin family protein